MKAARILVMLFLLVYGSPAEAAQPPDDVEFTPDIVYAAAGDVQLKLNLSRPRKPGKPLPCIVVIHGGAWRGGDRAAHNNLTWQFAQSGYVSATVGYRFAPQHPWPAQIQDVKAAVRFLRANAARYNLDPARIGATGFSAGGHLAMMLGVLDKNDGFDDIGEHQDQSSKVQAVVSFFGPTDLTSDYPPQVEPWLRDFIGGSRQEKLDGYRSASPITYVNAGDAPILMFQGTRDPLVPHAQATLMVDALTRAGVPGRCELIIGAGHGWSEPELRRTLLVMMEFFARHLK